MHGRIPTALRPPRRRGARCRVLLLVAFLACLAGCASPFARSKSDGQERFRHRALGYEIDRPSVLEEPGWKQVRIEESDFAVRHPDGSAFALASNCRATRATPRQLADQLRRSSGGRPIGAGEELEHAGLPGFVQELERVEGGRWLRIRTVTLRGARCTYDWLLLAPDAERLASLRPEFDAWWQSFLPAPVERPAEGGGR